MTTQIEYEVIRDLVRTAVQNDLKRNFPDIRLTRIDFPALSGVKNWQNRVVGHWDWQRITKRAKRNRYDLAIWYGGRLCGLGFGPGDGDWIAINFLEGDPDKDHPLKGRIIDIAIQVLEAQAGAQGAAEMRLLQPFPELVERYKARGYDRLAEQPDVDYLAKKRATS